MDEFLSSFFEKKDEDFVEEFEFINEYENSSDKVYCICEGPEDKICYLPRIKSILRRDIKIYDVGGKDNVVKLYNRCSNYGGYDWKRLIFIVDRDFDEPLGNDDIYELPVYALENLYVKPEVLQDFVESIIRVSNKTVISRVLDNYLSREKEFNMIIQELNICLYYTKKIFEGIRMENKEYSSYKEITLPCSDDNEVKKSLNISLTKIEATEGLNDIKSRYSFISQEAIDRMKVGRFSIENARENYKGKYQMHFFLTYVRQLLIDMNLGKGKASQRILADKNYGCNIGSNDTELFNTLSNYVQLPICFDKYIRKFSLEEHEHNYVF